MIIEVSKLHLRQTLEPNTALEQATHTHTRAQKLFFTILFLHRSTLEILPDSG